MNKIDPAGKFLSIGIPISDLRNSDVGIKSLRFSIPICSDHTKSSSAVQKPHSKEYYFYSIFPCIFLNMIYIIIIKSSERPIHAIVIIINNRYHRIIRDIFTFGLMTELLTVLRVEVED